MELDDIITYADKRRGELEGVGLSDGLVNIITEIHKKLRRSNMDTTQEVIIKEATEATRDWATACELVERAVNTEAERILREDNLSPEAFIQSETLRAAWIRIKQG